MLKNLLKVEGIEKLDRNKLESINGAWWHGGCEPGECWWEASRYVCCAGVPDL